MGLQRITDRGECREDVQGEEERCAPCTIRGNVQENYRGDDRENEDGDC